MGISLNLIIIDRIRLLVETHLSSSLLRTARSCTIVQSVNSLTTSDIVVACQTLSDLL